MGYDLQFVNPVGDPPEPPEAPDAYGDNIEKLAAWLHDYYVSRRPYGYFHLSIHQMPEMMKRLWALGMLAAPERAGIPVEKLTSNDGWTITPDEIRAALVTFCAHPPEAVALAGMVGADEAPSFGGLDTKRMAAFAREFGGTIRPTPEELAAIPRAAWNGLFLDFLEWLHRAADRGGVEVH